MGSVVITHTLPYSRDMASHASLAANRSVQVEHPHHSKPHLDVFLVEDQKKKKKVMKSTYGTGSRIGAAAIK